MWGGLAALAIAHAALAFVPSMWGWSLNLHRFLPPGVAWIPWALAVAALLPALSRPIAPWLARAGDALARRPLWLGMLAALTAGATVWLLPDRVHYVGDFQIRAGAARHNIPTEFLFPQALPLDLLLHHTLPGLVAGLSGLEMGVVFRALGALEAAALAAFSVAFVRALGLAGIAASAAALVVMAGGYLGMFTGYGKAFAEMSVLVAAVGTCALTVARGGRGLVPLGLAVAVGLALHRSAVAFLLPMAVAWGFALHDRRAPRPGARKIPWEVLIAVGLPVVVLVRMARGIVSAVRSSDSLHFSPEGTGAGGAIAAALRPLHLVDVANTVILVAPLAWAVPALAIALGPRLWRSREGAVLLALAAPFVGALLLVHPRQGMFRDWDDFAASGVAISLLAAWLVGASLRSAGRHAWLGVAVILGAAGPALQWLAHQNDVELGLRRVEAYLTEPPERTIGERAASYSFLATRNAGLGRLDAAADAAARAAEAAPSPRLLYEWASAEAARGNLREAREILRGLVEKASPMILAWIALARVSYDLGDLEEARRAAGRALDLEPNHPAAREVLGRVERQERTARP